MVTSLIIGVLGMVTLTVFWLIVQRHWANAFSDHISDEDVLAERSSCGNCGCTKFCENKNRTIK
jgi:hypothetical protein